MPSGRLIATRWAATRMVGWAARSPGRLCRNARAECRINERSGRRVVDRPRRRCAPCRQPGSSSARAVGGSRSGSRLSRGDCACWRCGRNRLGPARASRSSVSGKTPSTRPSPSSRWRPRRSPISPASGASSPSSSTGPTGSDVNFSRSPRRIATGRGPTSKFSFEPSRASGRTGRAPSSNSTRPRHRSGLRSTAPSATRGDSPALPSCGVDSRWATTPSSMATRRSR